jgi:hypothetical protein
VLDPPNLGVWWWVLRLAPLAAAVGAVMLARRRREYAPVAVFLCWVLLSHVVRPLIRIYIGAGPAGGVPYQGLERAAFHVEEGMFVSWPIGITALAIRIFTKRRAWPVMLGVYLVVVAILVLGYPLGLRRAPLQSFYLGVTLACLFASFTALASWWRSKPSGPPEPPEIVAGLLVLFEVSALLGPYAAGLIDRTWPIATALYFALHTTLAILQGLWLRRRS